MTSEQQNRAIAKWMHPTASDAWIEGFLDGQNDFSNDLNAIHEAEIRLSPEEWGKYVASLASNEDDQTFALVHATAKQKTKSLVVAIGKWTATDQRKDK